MKKITILFLFINFISIQAQERLSTTKGTIHFEASVPLFEEIKAKNENVNCFILLKTNEINCSVYMYQFQFKRDLMHTHFNENYLESTRYPKATFVGKIDKFDYKSLSDQPTEYQIKGTIRIHGKSKKISCIAVLKKVNNGLEISSEFTLNTDDFNIEIPSIVIAKVSKQVNTKLKAVVLEESD